MLNNLIDAVNGTDWWMFGVYVASIVASGVLSVCLLEITRRIGKQQNRMQKEQLLISNFNLYCEIHRDLYHLKIYSETVLPRIYDYLASNADMEEQVKLKKLENDFERMAHKIETDEADYLLRFGENEIIKNIRFYSDFVSTIFGATTSIKSKKKNNLYTINDRIQIRNECVTDNQWLDKIKKLYPDEGFIDALNIFIQWKYQLFDSEYNVLKKIQTAYRDCESANNNLSENKLR